MKLVNIYNKGQIPFLFREGPLLNHLIGDSAYNILKSRPDIEMELVNGKDEELEEKLKRQREAKEEEAKTSEIVAEESYSEEVAVEEPSETLPEDITVEDDDIDAAIDALGQMDIPTFDPDMSNLESLEEVQTEKSEIKKYSKKKLETMTKRELKEILKERGYIEGRLAPKYHDTVATLVSKVLETQK